MSSPLADDSESFYTKIDARGTRAALNAALAKRDGKAAKARKQNSSNARGVIGVLRQADSLLLAAELLRRFKVEQKRTSERERKQQQRKRLSRKKA